MRKVQWMFRYLRNSLFVFALWPTILSAQNYNLDSLLNVLRIMPEDTNKANTMYAIARTYLSASNDYAKVGEYGRKELLLAQKLNYKNGMAHAMVNLGIMYRTTSINYDLALYYDRTALKFMRELGNKKGESIALSGIGLTFYEKGDYKHALEYMKRGMEIKRNIGDKAGVATVYNNMGIIFETQGNYTAATNAHLTALKIREELQDKIGIASCYNNIGTLLYSQERQDEALGYYLKAAQIREEAKIFFGLALIYGNIGNFYRKKKQFKEALTYMLKEFKVNEQLDDKPGIALSYINIAGIYFDQNKSDIALTYQLKAYALAKETENKLLLMRICGEVANSYAYKKKFENAVRYNQEMLALSKEMDAKEIRKLAYESLASIYKDQNYFEKALEYTELYNTMKDSLLNKENFKQVAELNTRYETDKKENEILLLTKDQQLNAKIIRQQQLVRWGLLCGLALLSVSIFSIYRRYRFKQKANVILEQQKEEIQQKNTLITDSIEYAQTIQEAVLPTKQEIIGLFPQSFILYKPKATVSGDFYWVNTIHEKLVCAVADCTGHGVPGAFMSLLGYNMLENVTKTAGIVRPSIILDALDQEVATRLAGNDSQTSKHGMDISLITIDKKTDHLEFAGAHNSLFIIRDRTFIELKADKWGVGSGKQTIRAFTNHSLELKKGDMIYLFTDGFPDQIGGTRRKKFYYQPFKDLLLTISTMPPEEQKMKLNDAHRQWMGDKMDQTDDILIMGIRYV